MSEARKSKQNLIPVSHTSDGSWNPDYSDHDYQADRVTLDLFDFAETLTESDVRRIFGLTARIAELAEPSDVEQA